MQPSDLITVASLKAWATLPAVSSDDQVLGDLVSQSSRAVLSYLNRGTVLPRTYSEVFDGNDKGQVMLKGWPVQSITSLTIDGVAIPKAVSFNDSGYLLGQSDPEPPGARQLLILRGFRYCRGIQNINVLYPAGYQINGEQQTIASAAATAQQPYGAWGSDLGVINASTGVSFVKVANSPAQGQYALNTTKPGGYVFNAADDGVNVLLTYGFVPADLAMAVKEWCAERLEYRKRIGMRSKSLGGQETTSFAITDMPAFVMARLQQFMGVATF